jgi:hypothetical protein
MITAVKAVRDHSALKGARKAILYTAATYASKDGTGVFISKSKIAKAEHCSRETVNQAFKEAEANGEIVPTGKKGRGQVEYSFKPWIERVQNMDRSATVTSPEAGRVPVQQMDTTCPESGHELSSNWTPPVQQMDTYITSTEQDTQHGNEQVVDQPQEIESPSVFSPEDVSDEFKVFKENMMRRRGRTTPDGWESFGSARTA